MWQSLSGQRFGRWVVLDEYIRTETGVLKWKCRCECGTERYVLPRNLKSGASQSCGCLNREQVRKLGKNLLGQTFGELTVVAQEPNMPGESLRWRCRCCCGGECVVSGTRLMTGKKTHCGCRTRKDFTKKDIAGNKYGMLTALYDTGKRDKKGCIIWHSKCECGNEIDISYNTLVYGDVVSCGCRKRQTGREFQKYQVHVADTSVDIIKSEKLKKNNKTGVTGVYMKRGYYIAEIQFQKVNYYLGSYQKLEDAASVRRQAKKLLHKDFADFYEKWRKRADSDQEWARENPISVRVKQIGSGNFEVIMLPDLSE